MWTMRNKLVALVLFFISGTTFAEQFLLKSLPNFFHEEDRFIQSWVWEDYDRARFATIVSKGYDDGTVYVWYFYKMQGIVNCLAVLKRFHDDSKEDVLDINTDRAIGRTCKIYVESVTVPEQNKILYVWNPDDDCMYDVASCGVQKVNVVTEEGAFSVDVLKSTHKLELLDGTEDESWWGGSLHLLDVKGIEALTECTIVYPIGFKSVSDDLRSRFYVHDGVMPSKEISVEGMEK